MGLLLPPHPRIVFLGSPEFALPALKALIEHGYDLVAVVTQPDRPKGRGKRVFPTPVKQLASEHGLRVLQPERASSPDSCDAIRRRNPDLLVVVAFGQILKRGLLDIPSHGALNIHASLLPKYRGAAPIQWAIISNEYKTGLTAMRMDEGLDTGPILLQEEEPISEDETFGELHDRLSKLSGPFLIRVLDAMNEGRLTEKTQDEKNASYAPKVHREMCQVRWEQDAREVSALIRALDPWPGAFTTFAGREIKLFSSRVVAKKLQNTVPGRVAGKSQEGLMIETGRGLLQIGALQMAGKRRMTSADFVRGFPLPTGSILGKEDERVDEDL